MLSARPPLVRELIGLALEIRRRTAPGDGLVVFPEGEILNLLSSRRNPLRHKLYIPGYLSAQNEPEVLNELEKAKPAAVVLIRRQTSEYGPGFFGQDYGRRIAAWIEKNYRRRPSGRWQRFVFYKLAPAEPTWSSAVLRSSARGDGE